MWRILLHAGHIVSMHDERLPNIGTGGEMVGERKKVGPPARRLHCVVTQYCSIFGMDATVWTHDARDVSEWYRIVEERAKICMTTWTKARHAEEQIAVFTSSSVKDLREVGSSLTRSTLAGISAVFRTGLIVVYEDAWTRCFILASW